MPDGGSKTAWRLRNALHRLASGLPPRGEVLYPGVANDLFHAHLAVYRFAGRFASGARVLDLGCGTGYGSGELLAAGATAVVGIDPRWASVRFARRHFGGARFAVGRAEELAADRRAGSETFAVVVAANVLPQVTDLDAALAGIRRVLAPGGRLVASLPPLLDGQALSLYQANPSHRQALYLWDWLDRLREGFAAVRLFRQEVRGGRVPDLGNPGPAGVTAADHDFVELPLADLYDVGSLAAVVVAELAAGPR